jgi:beta-phosphoglucomutase
VNLLRALMIDLDGTLARTAEANLVAYSEALREVGVNISREEFNEKVQGRHWKQFLPGILSEAGVDIDPATISSRKGELYKARIGSIELNTGLVRLLVSTRSHLKSALVTSAARVSVEALLQAHGLDRLFDVIVTGDDVRKHKPDPEAYQLAAKLLNVLPDETLIYEDSDIGVESATAFGGHVLRIVF